MGSPQKAAKPPTAGKPPKAGKGKGKKVKPTPPPKVPSPHTVKKNSTIMQLAKGKVIRQSATIVNVRMQPMNPFGLARLMNPNVHTIAIPSQAPVAFPSAVVNRASSVTAISATTMTAGTRTQQLAEKLGSLRRESGSGTALPSGSETALPLGSARENPLFDQLQSPMLITPAPTASPSRATLPPGPPVTRTRNRESHQQTFRAFNARYQSANSSDAAKTRLVEIATQVLKDTNDTDLIRTYNAARSGGYYQRLHDALQNNLHGQ